MQGRGNDQISPFAPHTVDPANLRQHIPARRPGQVGVQTASVVIEILRQTRVHFADGKVHRCVQQRIQCLSTLFGKAALIQRVSVHNRHMAEHGTVFLFAIGKTKHTTQVELFFFKVRIQAVTADFFFKEIAVCTPADLRSLLGGRCAVHDAEYLTGQHHAR